MKKILKIILLIIAVLIIGGIIAFNVMSKISEKQISEIEISDVDLKKVQDGVYKGSCSVIPVTADVQVTVEDHKIIDIKIIKHVNGQGAKAEILANKVVQSQSLNVDVISGATISSKVIIKAIENALNNAIE